MARPKQKYNVYKETAYDYGNGNLGEHREFVGTTWAVSAEKAEANMAYRLGIKTFYWADYAGDGCRVTWLDAILAEEDQK